jgi:hypothetical protein
VCSGMTIHSRTANIFLINFAFRGGVLVGGYMLVHQIEVKYLSSLTRGYIVVQSLVSSILVGSL